MTSECTQLRNQPVPFKDCPSCGAPFVPFLRGTVQRSHLSLARFLAWWRDERWCYCALICSKCKDIVGYEAPRRTP